MIGQATPRERIASSFKGDRLIRFGDYLMGSEGFEPPTIRSGVGRSDLTELRALVF